MKRLIFMMLLIGGTAQAETIERFISILEDFDNSPLVWSNKTEGTLRTLLHDACNNPGDDWIRFADFNEDKFSSLTIVLSAPLAIPQDCNGSVTIDGTPISGTINPEPIINGSRLSGGGRTPGDLCMINVYSDNHTIKNLTFLGAQNGAAICFFGRRNTASDNRFNKDLKGSILPNRFDVVVSEAFAKQTPAMSGEGNVVQNNRSDGSGLHSMWVEGRDNTVSGNAIRLPNECGVVVYGTHNAVSDNTITGSGNHGVVLAGEGAILFGNKIQASGGCPVAPFQSQPEGCNTTSQLGGAGVFVAKTGKNAEIGHADFKKRNVIQYNISGGVILENSPAISGIHVFHNTINNNYGANIDLGDDGITPNDLGDIDSGPNTLFNTSEHFQMFPLVAGPGGDRYWGWGLAFDATSAELASVGIEEQNKKLLLGGAETWLGDFYVAAHTFEWMPGSPAVSSGTYMTPLVHKPDSSEYGLNIWAKADADLDGIPDDLESKSNPNEADTDFDGLPDPVEDRNRNGVCDMDETCAFAFDTDGDGASDWAETRGDGRYDPKTDSNPWIADTDGDGLKDGQEDTNNNGIWDGYLGETSPLLVDSDADGFLDAQDTCKIVPNPQQEPWFCM